jgi:hypothetical protein
MIEDGADFKGSIEIDRSATEEVDKNVSARAAAGWRGVYTGTTKKNGRVAGEMARVYIDGDLQGPVEKTQSKTKGRRGDEDCALVCVGGVLAGGIAGARDGDGAESV